MTLKNIAQTKGRYAEQKPQSRIFRAYLTQNIHRNARIIPYIPAERNINNGADAEFNACYKKSAYQRSYDNIYLFALIYEHKKNHCDSARQEHGPMSSSPGEQFKHSVAKRSAEKSNKKFQKRPHQITVN